jgi:hypothetical protein
MGELASCCSVKVLASSLLIATFFIFIRHFALRITLWLLALV